MTMVVVVVPLGATALTTPVPVAHEETEVPAPRDARAEVCTKTAHTLLTAQEIDSRATVVRT